MIETANLICTMFPVPIRNKPTHATVRDALTEKIKHPNVSNESEIMMQVFWLILFPKIIKTRVDTVIPNKRIALIKAIP